MRRAGKRVKAKGGAKLPVAKRSRSNESSRVRDLEQRLAEALKREAAALDQQTATGEILRVIASSPTDLQPTFDAIAASAVRLCEAAESAVVRFDGRLIHLVADHGTPPQELDALQQAFPLRADRGTATGRALLTGSAVQVDVATDPEYEHRDFARFFRFLLSVPMLRDGVAVGAINVNRGDETPFSDSQVSLLE